MYSPLSCVPGALIGDRVALGCGCERDTIDVVVEEVTEVENVVAALI